MADDKNNSQNYNVDNEDLLETDVSTGLSEEKELEKYGVWVKAGPEEIDDIDENTDFTLSDLNDEEVIITAEEEEILGDLEKELSYENPDLSENLSEISDETLEESELELDISDLDDLELEELTSTSENPDSGVDEQPIEEPFDLDIDFDDDLSEIEELAEINSSSDQEISNIDELDTSELDLDDLDDLELEDLELDDLELAELNIEEEKQEDIISNDSNEEIISDIEDDLDLDIDLLLDSEEITDLNVDQLLEEDLDELNIDNDLNIEDLITEVSSENIDLPDTANGIKEISELETSETSEIFEDIIEIDEDIVEEDFDETERIIEDLTEFDDIPESDFETNLNEAPPTLTGNLENSDIASEILKKIEQELLSIKNELHDVKKELSTLRPEKKLNNAEEIDESGFFEEDEDETIALTGDELDNILNTADIIEEAGSETDLPDELVEFEDTTELFEQEEPLVDKDDIIIIEEEELTDSEEIIDKEINLDNDVDKLFPEIIEEDILLTDLDSEDLNPSANEVVDLSEKEELENIEEITLDIEDLDLNIDEVDLDIEEISLDTDEVDLDIEEISLDTDEVDLDIEEISLDTDEIDLDIEEISLDTDEVDLDIEELDLVTEEVNLDIEELDLITEEVDLDIKKIDTIAEEVDTEEINLDIDNFADNDIPKIPSEPEGTTTIDMELPEMQEDSLTDISPQLKTEIKSVLSYMDQLLESLPEDKIDEFANSEHYEVYKKLFEELGLN